MRTMKGRAPLNETALTPAEHQRRHRDRLREAGKKFFQITIESAENLAALRRIREREGLRSDTAAANHIINMALELEREQQ